MTTTTTTTAPITDEEITTRLAGLAQRTAGQSIRLSVKDLIGAGCTDGDIAWIMALGAARVTTFGITIPEFEECGDDFEDLEIELDHAQYAVLIGLIGCTRIGGAPERG